MYGEALCFRSFPDPALAKLYMYYMIYVYVWLLRCLSTDVWATWLDSSYDNGIDDAISEPGTVCCTVYIYHGWFGDTQVFARCRDSLAAVEYRYL